MTEKDREVFHRYQNKHELNAVRVNSTSLADIMAARVEFTEEGRGVAFHLLSDIDKKLKGGCRGVAGTGKTWFLSGGVFVAHAKSLWTNLKKFLQNWNIVF